MKGMGLLVSWNTVTTEETVWFLWIFILLLSSPPVETQMKECALCCDIAGPVTFLEVLCRGFIHVCCDWGGTATLLYQNVPKNVYSLFPVSSSQGYFEFPYRRISYGLRLILWAFPYKLLLLLLLLWLSFSWLLLLSSSIRNIFG
jgi:hypothetical protein